jgi:predicted acetyltransferase
MWFACGARRRIHHQRYMHELMLRLPREDEALEFMRAHQATSPDVPSFLHFYADGIPLSEYLKVLADSRDGKNLPAGSVPETFLFGFVGQRIVGRVAIRHALTAALEREGGHIGYVVVPEFRRRGYATQLLALALRLAREQLGLDEVLVTCDDNHVGSIRVIERNRGVLQDIIAIEGRQGSVRRYHIRA